MARDGGGRSSRVPPLTLGLPALAVAMAVAVIVAGFAAVGSSAAKPPNRTSATQTVTSVAGASAQATELGISRDVGQMIIATYAGATPPASLLADIRAGRFGAIILMGDNTPSIPAVRSATAEMQAAARSGGHPGLLIMTDQEGGEVERLAGEPPLDSALEMGRLYTRSGGNTLVTRLGERTGEVLREAGIDLDLAPDADVVSDPGGFINQEQRSFGSSPSLVADAACSFASGLSRAGVGYTLKHFPGLGDAGPVSTDSAPVSIDLSARQIDTDDSAYRKCGNDPLAAVMVSNASYPAVTGSTPAVLSPVTYDKLLPENGVHGLVISDSFSAGSITPIATPALKAFRAGLDMVMYPDEQSDAEEAYADLLHDADTGALSQARVRQAAAAVLAFKAKLHLG